MVHEALLETLADPSAVSAHAARELLFARLASKLSESMRARECGARPFARID
jgi:hypothetical protein